MDNRYETINPPRATLGQSPPATSVEQLLGALQSGLDRVGRLRRQLEVIADRVGVVTGPLADKERVIPEAHSLHGKLQVSVNALHGELDQAERTIANLYPVLFDTSNQAQAPSPGR